MTKQARQNVAQVTAVFVVVAGLVAFTRGVWLAWHPGGWMVGGLAIASPALFWLYNDVRSSKDR